MATVRWRELLAETERTLISDVDARRIVEEACGDDWMLRLDEPATQRAVAYLDAMVARRTTGEPLQYVLGLWGFRRLELVVDRRVLIPRPETEMVVEVALAELGRLGASRPLVVDLGTGSGAIAISVALEVPGARVWGTDRSKDALAVARANLAGMGGRVASRVRLAAGDWFAALPRELRGGVDLVVANPPYVGDDEVLPPEVAEWEPPGALFAGPTGLESVSEILEGAPTWLCRPGAIVVEIAPHQAERVLELAGEAGFSAVDVHADLAGRPRVLVGRLLV